MLRRVADSLCDEVGCAGDSEVVLTTGAPSAGERGMAGAIDPEDEQLVAQVRRRLAALAQALGAGRPPGTAVEAALDGSEMAMWGEIASGNRDRLPSLMPSFVLLVALPIVGHDEALALSRRASELVAAATGG